VTAKASLMVKQSSFSAMMRPGQSHRRYILPHDYYSNLGHQVGVLVSLLLQQSKRLRANQIMHEVSFETCIFTQSLPGGDFQSINDTQPQKQKTLTTDNFRSIFF